MRQDGVTMGESGNETLFRSDAFGRRLWVTCRGAINVICGGLVKGYPGSDKRPQTIVIYIHRRG